MDFLMGIEIDQLRYGLAEVRIIPAEKQVGKLRPLTRLIVEAESRLAIKSLLWTSKITACPGEITKQLSDSLRRPSNIKNDVAGFAKPVATIIQMKHTPTHEHRKQEKKEHNHSDYPQREPLKKKVFELTHKKMDIMKKT